jgi:hypothetical protein
VKLPAHLEDQTNHEVQVTDDIRKLSQEMYPQHEHEGEARKETAQHEAEAPHTHNSPDIGVVPMVEKYEMKEL